MQYKAIAALVLTALAGTAHATDQADLTAYWKATSNNSNSDHDVNIQAMTELYAKHSDAFTYNWDVATTASSHSGYIKSINNGPSALGVQSFYNTEFEQIRDAIIHKIAFPAPVVATPQPAPLVNTPAVNTVTAGAAATQQPAATTQPQQPTTKMASVAGGATQQQVDDDQNTAIANNTKWINEGAGVAAFNQQHIADLEQTTTTQTGQITALQQNDAKQDNEIIALDKANKITDAKAEAALTATQTSANNDQKTGQHIDDLQKAQAKDANNWQKTGEHISNLNKSVGQTQAVEDDHEDRLIGLGRVILDQQQAMQDMQSQIDKLNNDNQKTAQHVDDLQKTPTTVTQPVNQTTANNAATNAQPTNASPYSGLKAGTGANVSTVKMVDHAAQSAAAAAGNVKRGQKIADEEAEQAFAEAKERRLSMQAYHAVTPPKPTNTTPPAPVFNTPQPVKVVAPTAVTQPVTTQPIAVVAPQPVAVQAPTPKASTTAPIVVPPKSPAQPVPQPLPQVQPVTPQPVKPIAPQPLPIQSASTTTTSTATPSAPVVTAPAAPVDFTAGKLAALKDPAAQVVDAHNQDERLKAVVKSAYDDYDDHGAQGYARDASIAQHKADIAADAQHVADTAQAIKDNNATGAATEKDQGAIIASNTQNAHDQQTAERDQSMQQHKDDVAFDKQVAQQTAAIDNYNDAIQKDRVNKKPVAPGKDKGKHPQAVPLGASKVPVASPTKADDQSLADVQRKQQEVNKKPNAAAKRATQQATQNGGQYQQTASNTTTPAPAQPASTYYAVDQAARNAIVNTQQQSNAAFANLGSRVDNNAARIDNQQGQINSLKGEVAENRKRSSAGIASVMASANIPVVPGQVVSVGAGVGEFDGQAAISVGANIAPEGSRVAYRASIGATSQGAAVGAGVAFGF